MKDLKIDTIILEGIDKTGKDTLVKYIYQLTKGKYAIYQRGLISNTVYAEIFNRNKYAYKLSEHTLYVLLTADIEDLNIRFKISNEPNIDINIHIDKFEEVFNKMTNNLHTLKFNTSHITPFDIAKTIVKYIDEVNEL